MIRQHHDSIDCERVALTRFLHGSAQRVDVIDQQSLSTLKKIDREEPAPTGHECTTIIWHSCTLAILCGNMRGVMPVDINGGLRFANPPYGLYTQCRSKLDTAMKNCDWEEIRGF